MQRVDLPDLDHASLEDAVPAGSYARGVRYAGQRAVHQMRWDQSHNVLVGMVRGSRGALYTTIAYFQRTDGSPMDFDRGVCSCPVGMDCKHVVALVLTAAGNDGAAQSAIAPHPAVPDQRTAASAPRAPAVPSPRPGWEQSLDSLLGSRPAAAAGRPASTPLAIELTLTETPGRPAAYQGTAHMPALRLAARMVQPGINGGWIAGSLSWSKLDSLQYYGHPAEHVGLLQEIYALYQARRHDRWSYYGDDKHIDLSAFESGRLWPLLDEADSVGLRLVRWHKLGDVPKCGQAELCVDVTGAGPAGALLISPAVRVDGTLTDAVPIRFIGSEGHGLVYVDRAEAERTADYGSWHFQLARLARPVPAQIQAMALADHRLEVPAAERSKFRDAYYLRLRAVAAVISTDGSFTPPEVSGPTLVLLAAYTDGHQVDIGWEWAYQVGDSRLRVQIRPDSAGAGYRDPSAELALLADLDLPLDRFGLLNRDQRGQAALSPGKVRLDGIDTMRFTTELLPLLADHPGVRVEVTGSPADYHEASDSLRVGVSADAVAGDTDWFDLGISITVDGQSVPFADVFTALSLGESYLLLAGGAYFSLCKPELQALARLIEEARALQDSPPGTLKISRFQAGLWDELAELGVVRHQARAWQEQVQGLLSLNAVERKQPPQTLHARLRPYQLDGFSWLAFLWEHQLGGILADDMGLGKTLQALALICHARRADPGGSPFLIVAPTSVVPNWAAEAARFAPDLKVVSVSDTQSRRGQALCDITAGADAVVTSYTLLRIDFEHYAAMSWSGLLLDEAQFAKNHQSKIYQCARRLPAPFKLAITGTPMENNLMELWSLLSIAAPGLFPNPVRFRDYYARPIEKQDHAELLAQLRRRIRPLVKRRTKEQVAADLPAKQEQVLEVDLHPRHRKLYQMHLQRERQKILGLIDDMNANRFTIFRSLTLLRQLSLHAGLVGDEHGDLPSSKIDVLVEQLGDVVGGGHRALVFSQFTGFLGKVRERLDAEGVQYCYLDGSTRDRAAVLKRFKEGLAPVFLISLKAGGFGLNLTEADYCFLLDPWWNPATEAQAVDRTHRIGQTRNVMVYRLIAKDTIEQKVMALKARKAELFASVLDDGNVFGASLDADDIRGLFD